MQPNCLGMPRVEAGPQAWLRVYIGSPCGTSQLIAANPCCRFLPTVPLLVGPPVLELVLNLRQQRHFEPA